MNINSFSASSIASTVWAQVTRTLTKATNLFATVATAPATIAASATVDLRPASPNVREGYLFLAAAAAGQLNIQSYDGVTGTSFDFVASATKNSRYTAQTNALGIRLQNGDGANSASYAFAGKDWQG